MGKLDRLKAWLPAILMMLLISILSSINGTSINSLGLGRESYHINGHFVLFVMLFLTYFKATKSIYNAIILTFMFAVIDEFHQSFTPFRSSSVFDIFVDTVGGLISGLIIWKFPRVLPKKLKNWLLK